MLGGIGPTDFDAEPQIQDHARNDGIPLGDVAILAPGERDGFWPVKHGEQRNAPQRREVRHQCARERLDLFIRDDRHLDPPRVLQARRKEMHAPLGAVEKADKDLPEVMLRELARHPLEAHDGPRRRRPHRAHQGVQRTFRAIISRKLGAPQELHAEQRGILRQPPVHLRAIRRRFRRTANGPRAGRRSGPDVGDHRLSADALHAALAHPGQCRDLVPRVARPTEDLNRVPLYHVDHLVPHGEFP